MITAHYQTPDGEWHEFETPPMFLYQATASVAAMFEGMPLPVVINIDGGYLCTRNVFAEVKQRHGRVMTFAGLKKTDVPLYKFLKLNMGCNYA